MSKTVKPLLLVMAAHVSFAHAVDIDRTGGSPQGDGAVADPLGQPPRPEGSYPDDGGQARPAVSPTEVTRRVQLLLILEGYYQGGVNGHFDSATRAALGAYLRDRQIPATATLDSKTLELLGIRNK